MAKAGTIRGLQVFISDIRACQNKEQETRRVDKELAKIRNKFGDDKKTLTGGTAGTWQPALLGGVHSH
jgi:hypothetical protein